MKSVNGAVASEQETLYVLQNSDLMAQIADSVVTHGKKKGYQPTVEQLKEVSEL